MAHQADVCAACMDPSLAPLALLSPPCRTVEEITPDFAIPPLEGTLQLPKSRL